MTRRDFDGATKENLHGAGMASDERCAYRERRCREHNGSGADCPRAAPSDYLAARAREMARLRAERYPWEPLLPTLGIGTRFRAPQVWRARTGRPLLAARESRANV